MDFGQLIERTVSGLGYEFVAFERSGKGPMVRVFIDKPGGIDVDDCASVSQQCRRLPSVLPIVALRPLRQHHRSSRARMTRAIAIVVHAINLNAKLVVKE